VAVVKFWSLAILTLGVAVGGAVLYGYMRGLDEGWKAADDFASRFNTGRYASKGWDKRG
jgi:hypothetical protein